MEDKIQMMDGAIKYLAGKYSNRMMSRDDLYNVGVQAILEALPFVKNKYSEQNYLFICISNAIISAAINSDIAVHIPSGSIANGTVQDTWKYKGTSFEEESYPVDVDNHDVKMDVDDILRKCDPRGIAQMHYIDGYTYPEIAKIKGMSRTSVCRYMKRFKENARDFYDA